MIEFDGLTFRNAVFTGIKINGVSDKKYYISIQDSIVRILTTRLGERVNRPLYGSNLHELRDREFDDEFRLLATKYVYTAIENNEPRVKFKKLHFGFENGRHTLYPELDVND